MVSVKDGEGSVGTPCGGVGAPCGSANCVGVSSDGWVSVSDGFVDSSGAEGVVYLRERIASMTGLPRRAWM